MLILTCLLGLCAVAIACQAGGGGNDGDDQVPGGRDDTMLRHRMVEDQIVARGITDEAVLSALRKVPRHRFVPEDQRRLAYHDGPLPIGIGQTISQPYIVALMTELSGPDPTHKVLEIGTGSGYQAAILAECFEEVYTIEIIPELGKRAESLLQELGYENIHVRIGDGYDGWPSEQPFDAIVVTAAPDSIPRPLMEQLAPDGKLVIPVGRGSQDLVVATKVDGGIHREYVTGVRFVPMTGKAQNQP